MGDRVLARDPRAIGGIATLLAACVVAILAPLVATYDPAATADVVATRFHLAMKTEGKLFAKVNELLKKSIAFFIVMYLIVTVYTLVYLPHLTDNLLGNIVLLIVLVLVFLSIANIPRLVSKAKYVQAFLFSSLTMSLLLVLVAIELFPVMVRSNSDPAGSLTIYNAASSPLTLKIMLAVALTFVPIVIAYQAWVYYTFKDKVRCGEDLAYEEAY